MVCLLQQSGAPYFDAEPIAEAVCTYHKTDWRYVDKHLVLAVMYRESRYRQSARSLVGAVGLMQLYCQKKYKKWWVCNQCNVRRKKCNILQGIKLLYRLKSKYTSLYPESRKNEFWWVQYYNYRSKGYAKRINKIRNDLLLLEDVKCRVR
ncbi:MAG TPA: transglycosylase SLT domain-containing protein [Desulfosporosinus sp.]|nr:transglycosylase SLT domain-containing protein [Desulfosporosinus sp.]